MSSNSAHVCRSNRDGPQGTTAPNRYFRSDQPIHVNIYQPYLENNTKIRVQGEIREYKVDYRLQWHNV